MKTAIRTILCAVAVVMAAVSCQKSIEPGNPAEEGKGTIDICVNGLMGEYSQQDGVKSSLVNNVRVAWAAGDVVYVFDGTKYLGKLTATLDKKADGQTDEDRYAKLSGTISAPATTPCVLSLVHSSLMAEPAAGSAVSELSIDMSAQSTAPVPFVAYATMDYTGTSISDVIVPFQFATSVIKVNCTGLKANTAITSATLSNVNTACKLTLSGSAAPSVSGDVNGTITRTGDSYFVATRINSEGEAVFQIAAPALEATSETRVLTIAQGSDKFVDNKFTTKPLAPATSVNTVCQLVPYVPVESVRLDRTSAGLSLGGTITLSATVLPDNATDKSVTWSSSSEGVASVDASGKVTGVSPGTATVTVTTTDGLKMATCTVVTGALSGVFSVSATKKVHFSQGNLIYNVSSRTWAFYEHQYDRAENGKASTTLISLFTWGYGEWSTGPTTTSYLEAHPQDESFNNEEDWGYVFGGKSSIWRTLTHVEWKYLVRNHKCKWVTVKGVKGYVIAPDGFSGELASSYADDAALAADNLVFLPAAGYRYDSSVNKVGDNGYFWSSTAFDNTYAYFVSLSSSNVDPDFGGHRDNGYSVRLITEVK